MKICRTFFVFVMVLLVASLSEAQVAKKFDWSSAAAAKELGPDFVSPEDITKFYPDVVYTEAEHAELAASVPSSKVDVWWLKHSKYILMPAPPRPMSLSEVRGLGEDKNPNSERTSFGWLAIKKEAVPKSVGKSWAQQVKLLSSNERMPSAVELAWVSKVFSKVRGIRLFHDVFVRTSSIDGNGSHIVVGFFTDDDPNVCNWTSDEGDPVVGIAAAGRRK